MWINDYLAVVYTTSRFLFIWLTSHITMSIPDEPEVCCIHYFRYFIWLTSHITMSIPDEPEVCCIHYFRYLHCNCFFFILICYSCKSYYIRNKLTTNISLLVNHCCFTSSSNVSVYLTGTRPFIIYIPKHLSTQLLFYYAIIFNNQIIKW